jgi:hypothetical protein
MICIQNTQLCGALVWTPDQDVMFRHHPGAN